MKNPAVTKEDVYEIKNQEKISVEPNHDAEMRKSHFKKCENRTLMILNLVILLPQKQMVVVVNYQNGFIKLN